MAFTGSALCNSFKLELLQGVHLTGDAYMIALYDNTASLTKATTAYTTSGEVAASGTYVAGGLALSGFQQALDTDTAYWDWTVDPEWTSATITARGALIYNATRTNKAVAVIDFGGDKTSTAGTFTIQLPAPAAATAIVRMA